VSTPSPEPTGYVVGFLLDTRSENVALIRKNRPEWQAGRLNGIGGHIEPGERPYEAMCREFLEETGSAVRGWHTLAVMDFPGARIHFYRYHLPVHLLGHLRSVTDEEVVVAGVGNVLAGKHGPIIPNLSWLLPLAAYTADTYDPIAVTAQRAEALV
jgi:8-oxo-dGTP diphosphatase